LRKDADWRPIQASERFTVLDFIRGVALFGVLIVNLLYFFRISLFAHIVEPKQDRDWIDLFVSRFIEFKAFALFSFVFGISVAVQTERARARGVNPEKFLARRFLILLLFGAIHLVFISNVDILTLYAVCGMLLIPFLRLPAPALGIAGFALLWAPWSIYRGESIPDEAVMRAHAIDATRVYGHGTFAAILAFRWDETKNLIAPLLFAVAQRTFGLMLLGMAVWRFGVVRALPGSPRAARFTAPFAAAGQMALTNYLTQSLVFSTLFYGYGLGLFGRLDTGAATALGVTFYGLQLCFSTWWLSRYRFGPFEWLWRSLTYGRMQPMGLQSGSRIQTSRRFRYFSAKSRP